MGAISRLIGLIFGVRMPETSLMHDGTAVAEPVEGLPTDVQPDFSGWATKYGLECSDGRTILDGAFKHHEMVKVPLVWQHGHSDPGNILGHTFLQHRDGEGVYAYGYFNDNEQAKNAKTLIEHDDINSLSIFANQLVEKVKKVSHGVIREVSLVLAGANPGALIDNLELQHAEGDVVTIEDEAVIYTGEELKHGDSAAAGPDASDPDGDEGEGPTVEDVYNDMSDDQKEVVHFMVGEAMKSTETPPAPATGDPEDAALAHSGSNPGNDKENARSMKRNVFDQTAKPGEGEAKHELSHEDIKGIAADAMKLGSMKEAVEAYALEHGIEDIDVLFPDARSVTETPEFDKRRTEWVSSVINGTRHSPFSRIKSIVADITHDEARARGYIKGTLKKEEFFGLVKRITTPTTIYKKQKLDRDDIIDITDFDVVVWLKAEMRLMLDEELARAVLIGDGRAVDDDDKVRDPAGVQEGAGIRSILQDHDLYAATVNVNIDDANSNPSEIVDAIVGNMRFYKGSGSPTFYTTLPVITQLLLSRDTLGRRLYRTVSELASELGVSAVVAVEVMEAEEDLVGIIVNLQDYTVGADRGGDLAMFDDFDIDYNQYKYLIETRLSGALTKIRSALVVKKVAGSDDLVAPNAPAFDPDEGEITITDQTGVVYKRADTNAVVNAAGSPYTVDPGESLTIYAVPASGYYFANNVEDQWSFDTPAA